LEHGEVLGGKGGEWRLTFRTNARTRRYYEGKWGRRGGALIFRGQ